MADFDIDEFVAGYERRVERVRICMRAGLLAEHARLEQELLDARQADGDNLHELAAQISELEDEIRAAEREFTFGALSSEAWQDLLRAHPPTKDQLESDRGLDHNPLTFPPAAVAASSVEPVLTVEAAKKLRSTLQFSDWQKLWGATLAANLEVSAAPKSVLATAVLRLSGDSSTSSSRGGSRGRRSSGGSGGRSRPTSTTKRAGSSGR